MNRRLLVTLGLLAIASAAAQDAASPVAPPAPPKQESESAPSTDWPGVEYAEVRAYLYNPPETRRNRILSNGKLHPAVVNPEGIKLDAARVKQLLQATYHRQPDRSGSGCFLPHHGFVFYDRDGKAVADLSICFVCTRAEGRPYSETIQWDMALLAQLIRDLGLPVFKDCDEANAHFSALAREWPDAKLKAALDQYLFSNFKEGPLEDEERSELLGEEDSLLRLLQGVGERAHPLLFAYLGDKDLHSGWLKTDPAHPYPTSRFHRLCAAFGATPPASAIPLLAPFLDEADAAIRCDAAETIAKTGAPQIVPLVRKAFSDPGDYVAFAAFEGLMAAMDRGTLHANAKAQLFPDVSDLEDDSIEDLRWAKALIDLDPGKALEYFLSPEVFNTGSPRLDAILTALCEKNLQVPRERLLKLAAELRATGLDRQQQWILKPALLLLGRQRHPDDLELLRGMGNETLARCAMPGLLAWHGLDGYRDRLSKLEEEKGFAALNESQRLHFAANAFESNSMGIHYYFLDAKGEQWRDALAGLKAMNRDKLAAILEEAIARFGEEGPNSNEATRRSQLEALREEHAFDELDERLKKTSNRWDLSLDRFAIEHAESFK